MTVVVISAIVVCLLATIYPSRQAGRLDPAEALQEPVAMAVRRGRGLVKSYRTATGRLDVLHGLDLAVEPGEMVAIVGASGVGKSTLLHVLGGLDAFDAGSVRIGDAAIDQMDDEARVAFRNRHVGFVFQFHHLLPEFTALENVEMPLRIAGRPAAERRGPRATRCSRASAWRIASTHRPGALSGGEQQRVAVARALVCAPVAAARRRADRQSRRSDGGRSAAAAARDAREHGLTSIIVTHNPVLAALVRSRPPARRRTAHIGNL